MPSPEQTTAAAPTVPWHDIEELLHEIGELAKSPRAIDDFAETVCRQARQTLSAEVVAIWLRESQGDWRLAAESTAVELGEGKRHAPGETSDEQKSLVAPFAIGAGRDGAIEVVLSANSDSQSERVPADVVEAIAELVGDFFRHQRIDELRDGEQQWRQLGELVTRIHGSLDTDVAAYRIANEGRTWLAVDRVSVLVGRTNQPRLVAMSGVDRIERRADLVRTMEGLVQCAGATGETLWYQSKALTLAPQIDDRLHQFLEHSPAKMLAVIPLRVPAVAGASERIESPTAFLVIEQFEHLADATPLHERLQSLAPHAAAALANARQHGRIPWASGFDRLSGIDRPWWLTRTAIAAAAIGATAVALTIIPADFKIEARGELQPKVRREVFAPADGVIAEVDVEHGQSVAQDAVLLTLTNSQLDLELARVGGELQTARKKLSATQALQLESDRSRENTAVRAHQLTADEEELKELIKSLEKQQQILTSQQAELLVRSPLAGKVLTWNVEPLLSARPVTRGQHLMTVADPAGPWELDLRVPDDRMGHVLGAQQNQQQPLALSFVVATDPGTVFRTRVDKIAQTAESDEHTPPTVTVNATVEPNAVPLPRPGAEVIAQIDCGRRSIGYVWFHDLVDAVRSWLWF